SNLCAHWTILWALWIFVDQRRVRQFGWWFAVIAVTGLIHNYLLLMVGAIWASAMLERLWRRDFAIVAAQGIGVAGLLAAIVALHGLIGPHYIPTHSYGAFPMALDAIVNPAHQGYVALLPSTPDDQGRGFEGFQYLGAGLLALIIAAIGVALVRRRPANPPTELRRVVWLIPAFVVLTVLAISNGVLLHGNLIAKIKLSPGMIDALDPLRASGRLFWPVAYTVVFAAIATIARLPQCAATIVLAGALLLQIVDLTPMLAATRVDTAELMEPPVYRRTPDPRWNALIAGSSAIEFQPPDPFRDLPLLEEIGWRAVNACRPMRFTYLSRVSYAQQVRIDEDHRQFLAGKANPTRLYVLYPGYPVPAGLRARARMLDGIVVIPPTAPAPPPDLCR
ncbi:MAG: DUF6311 domain-containing protein, partial [Pseudomonadota bacterium]|nr:DUF6311 domain-containing protein [Pseudomonadota bacterium]